MKLVAAQAGEAPAVAGRTSGFIEVQFSGRMAIQKVGRMVGRLEVHCRWVALRATEWRIDFGVAHEAIFHEGEICFGQGPCCDLKDAMTCLTGVPGNQIGAEFQDIDPGRRAEVLLAVNCSGNHWGKVSEAQVESMIEVLEDLAFVFIAESGCILLLRMTSEALEPFFKCILV